LAFALSDFPSFIPLYSITESGENRRPGCLSNQDLQKDSESQIAEFPTGLRNSKFEQNRAKASKCGKNRDSQNRGGATF
jgi:hypothetical protein